MANSIAGKLLKIIKTYPVLYDPNHQDYRCKEVVEPLWQDISKKLNDNDMELRKRWRNLRDTYVKLLRLIKKNEKDEVFKAAAVRKYYKWIWTREMEFFRPYLTYGNKLDQSNLRIENIDTLNEEPNVNANEPEEKPKVRPTRNLKRRSFKEDSSPSPPPVLVQKTTRLSNFALNVSTTKTCKLKNIEKPSFQPTSDLELDATDRLFLAHAQNIKQFSVRRQAMTKLKIAEVIMEQEILHQEDMELASISTATAKHVRRRKEDTPPPFETVCGYNSDEDETFSYAVAKNEKHEENNVDDDDD